MTKETYRIPESKRADITKTLTRYSKKAAKYGGSLEAEYGATYAAMIPVYTQDGKKVDEELHEVFDLTITGEPFKLNGFSPIARIEHLDGGNVVTPFFGFEIKPEWTKIAPYCEHCGANHGLKKTIIVRGANGDKQVGRTCLKDYCGIDPQAVGIFNELNAILVGEEKFYDYDVRTSSKALDVVKVLGMAIDIIKGHGYTRSNETGSNKDRLIGMIGANADVTEESLSEAKQMAEVIASMTSEEAVEAKFGTVYGLVKNGYCKMCHLGFIAYAPLAYKNMLERKAKKAEQVETETQSKHIGKVGERTYIEVAKCEHITEWATDYGMTHLYKITDDAGNILIWYASKLFGHWVENDGCERYEIYDDVNRIKCTIKEHTEYKGVKQTVITRCAYVA